MASGAGAARLATETDMRAAYEVRRAVFIDGQGVPAEIERDEHDGAADHAVAEAGGRIVATGRLVRVCEDGSVGIVGRMAVLPGHRGRGLGAAVLLVLEARARERGMSSVELHAQTHARGFYEGFGYAADGPEYDEAGIRHVSMRKNLPGVRPAR